ncbi:peptidase domain-containing ABC transporter [Burkholderia pseudomallei]|uniref:peptidase domain-containing ABC transporter n=1 Tax=Burkholderia pseudomallei TaxID=28450 RepID=UPI0021F7EA54|nr:peptidase domain-containing ABC transporter [Burkholderia pseudomallei]MCW0161106.1 peptidase domain-containing ABC transporter [Burkholderia pseudomallei]
MPSAMKPEHNDAIVGGRGEAIAPDVIETRERLHFGRARRLPMIRQSEAAECGLACLAMIASYYGHHVELPALRRHFALSLKGATLAQLIGMAQSLGLVCRPLRLEFHELGQLQVPCILHWDLKHFVVLRKVTKRGALIHDPAVGERSLDFAELSKHVTGVGLELSKGPTFQRKKAEPPVSLLTLAGSIQGLGRALLAIFGLALALELFALLAPQLMQMVVDQVLADGDRDLLTFLGLSFCLLVVLQTTITALRTWSVLWLSTHFSLNWTGNVFQHLLRLPQAYFLKRHLGDIVSRFGAISTIQQTLTTRFVGVVLDGLMAALTLVVMALYSPLLLVLTIASVALYGGLRLLYFRVYREANLGQVVVQAKQQSHFMEAVRGVQTLRLFNQVPTRSSQYLNVTADALNAGVAVQRLSLVFSSVQGLATGAEKIAVLWLGAWLALRGQFSAGMLMAFVAYADQFTARASSLVDYLIEIRLLRIQGERLADIVLAPIEKYAEGEYAGPLPNATIRFEGVSFRYGAGEPWILKDCSFEIAAGESVAIVGPSGCGKSTLVRLLLGLLDLDEGVISIGGIDMKHLGKNQWREMVGCVLQDDRLFAGSIADNISFFDEGASFERIELMAKLAKLHGDIVRMPMGYHSLVGDMGASLSGGQVQRLLLARALYRRPKVLVLDEATSHLDVATERTINETVKRLPLTRVLIAHRLETIASADRVLDLRRLNKVMMSSKL